MPLKARLDSWEKFCVITGFESNVARGFAAFKEEHNVSAFESNKDGQKWELQQLREAFQKHNCQSRWWDFDLETTEENWLVLILMDLVVITTSQEMMSHCGRSHDGEEQSCSGCFSIKPETTIVAETEPKRPLSPSQNTQSRKETKGQYCKSVRTNPEAGYQRVRSSQVLLCNTALSRCLVSLSIIRT